MNDNTKYVDNGLVAFASPINVNKLIMQIESKLKNLEYRAPEVLTKAINATANKIRSQLMKDTRKEVAVKKPSAKKQFQNSAMKNYHATISNMVAKLIDKGIVTELGDYDVTPSEIANGKSPAIYQAKVYKANSKKQLKGYFLPNGIRHRKKRGLMKSYKPFLVKFEKSGHITIVTRVPGVKMESNPQKEFIKKLLSPAVPTMIGKRNRMELATNMVYELLPNEIEKHISKILDEYKI